MGVGGSEKLHLSFHIHIPHLHFQHHKEDVDGDGDGDGERKLEESRDIMRRIRIPKGCFAILVGQGEEQQQRFVVPVMYVNHPLFVELLKDAEEEFGFHHDGPITIPCHVDHFRTVQGLIDGDKTIPHHHHHHHHHLLHLPMWCFRASSH